MSDIKPAAGVVTRTEIVVRRSRFIALLARAADEEQAREFVAGARREFPDARHHCSAFVVSTTGANPVMRSADDGEPPGTAGMPMLDVLRASGLCDVVAVVVRYFGGTKLGTGGLVRAYSDAVRAALERTPTVRAVRLSARSLELSHAEAARVEAELRARGVGVADVEYTGTGTQLTLLTDDVAGLYAAVQALTSGGGELRPAGERVVEISAGS